jgi:uncharacterized repeat protein (TIGR03803 family)
LGLAAPEARANDHAWALLANFPANVFPRDDSPLLEYNGNFYGTTSQGGTNGQGDVFQISPTGQWTELYSFTGGDDGGYPLGGLAFTDGNFYGVTLSGGAEGNGTVFSMTPSGDETPIHSFTCAVGGCVPFAGLALGPGGLLYGTTYYGGTNSFGGIFSISTAGQLTELYSFTNGVDGVNVATVLAEGLDGDLYGASQSGGTNDGASGNGTIFKITPGGTFSLLYTFTNGADGNSPNGGLTPDASGNFYGTTASGGAFGNGTAFELTQAGSFKVLYAFTGGQDGSTPGSILVLGGDGNFYGTTLFSGPSLGGTAFQMTPAGVVSNVLSFNNVNSGSSPGDLVEGSDSNFYGLTIYGGSNGDGTIFKFSSSVQERGLQAQLPNSEYSALTDLYNDTTGPGWYLHQNWSNGAADNWYGVTVAPLQYDANWNLLGPTHVETLNLAFNNLAGILPNSIGNFPFLQTLLLNYNFNIGGTIPDNFTNLTQAQYASLAWNDFTGGLPAGLANLSQMTNFEIEVNELTNGIPEGLGSLSLLRYLNIGYNQFGGTIPNGLTNLAQLQYVVLDSDDLTGALPPGLGGLTNLYYLDLGQNDLNGAIPAQLSALSGLETLVLNQNGFSGGIPASFSNLTHLQYIDLSACGLTGTIPTNFAALNNLDTVILYSNALSGLLPVFTAGYLDVTWNDFIFDTNSTDYNVVQAMIANGQTVNYLPQNIPAVVAEPTNLTVNAGQTAVFSAGIVNGSTFQWFFNGQPLTNGPLVSGAQSTLLTLTNVQSSKNGGYDLIAANSFGSATSLVATLTVSGSPFSFGNPGLIYSNGHAILQITGLANQGPVVIDASTNLTQWTPIFTNPSATGAITFTDSNAASYSRRFYRATVP